MERCRDLRPAARAFRAIGGLCLLSADNAVAESNESNNTGYEAVTIVPDADEDGLDDDLEYELALSHRPRLVIHEDEPQSPVDCDERTPFWGVRPSERGNDISIYYALAYTDDCGFPPNQSAAHLGDTETIVVELEEAPAGGYTIAEAFYSAHYQGPWDVSEWYDFWDLELYVDLAGDEHATAYVAWGKHANYDTEAACNYPGYDECSDDVAGDVQWPEILQERNLGEHPTVGTSLIDSWTDSGRTEFFWGESKEFCGWQVATTNSAVRQAAGCAGEQYSYYNQLDDWAFNTLN